jgi:hypothetical protein
MNLRALSRYFGTGWPLRGAVVLSVAIRTRFCFTAAPVN